MMHLSVLAFFGIASSVSKGCDFELCLLPNDPYVFIGERLALNCSVSTNSNCSGNLSFMMGNHNISSQHYHNISPGTIHLDMPVNETLNHVTIECVDLAADCMGDQFMKVEYPPREVSNWTVVIYDWETLNLTWDPGQYIRPENVSIHTTWSPGHGWYNCSQETRHWCYLDKDNYNDSDNYTFAINVTNKILSKSTVTDITIASADYVKPAPITKLTVTNQAQRTRDVTLKWESSRKYRPFQFKVNYTRDNITLWSYTTDTNITIPDLKPHTEYSFGVSARSDTTTKGYWSDTLSINYTTNEDKPTYGPSVTRGSFTYHKCVDNKRNVSIYLKPPAVKYRNGILTSYTATYKSRDGYKTTPFPYPASSITVSDLLCDTDYNVMLLVSTSAGPSPQSVLHIPQQRHDTVPHFVGVLIPANDTQVQVHWDFQHSCKYSNWTVYWCHVVESHTCNETLDWKVIGGTYNFTDVAFTRNDIISRDINFAVSGDNCSGNSGMVWSTCWFDLHKDTPILDLSDSHPNLGLSVRWSVKECAAGTLVRSYVIQHCYNTVCVNEIVPKGKREHTILNLKGNVAYSVKIKLISVTGSEGLFSKAVIGVPDNKYLRNGLVIGGITGGLVLTGIALLLLVKFIRHFRLALAEREFIEMPRGVLADLNTKPCQENNSPDSGNISMDAATISLLLTENHYTTPHEQTGKGEDATQPSTHPPDYARFTTSTSTARHEDLSCPQTITTSGEHSIDQSNGKQFQNESISGWDDMGSGWRDDDIACPYVTAGLSSIEDG